jgi:hypothetical protein
VFVPQVQGGPLQVQAGTTAHVAKIPRLAVHRHAVLAHAGGTGYDHADQQALPTGPPEG